MKDVPRITELIDNDKWYEDAIRKNEEQNISCKDLMEHAEVAAEIIGFKKGTAGYVAATRVIANGLIWYGNKLWKSWTERDKAEKGGDTNG